MNDIPDFLRRGPKEQPVSLTTMNEHGPTQAPEQTRAAAIPPEPAPPATMPQPRKRKMDCFTRRIAIHIPISFQETDSLPNAIVALSKLAEILPPDSMVETISEGFGKMPSEARR